MKSFYKIQSYLSKASSSLGSIIKVLLISKQPSKRGTASGSLIIMGNGPSLNDAIAYHRDILESNALLSVNFAPITQEFFELKPEYHILADPGFFSSHRDNNMQKLWDALTKIDWPITIFIPSSQKRNEVLKMLPKHINLKFFNTTPIEGWHWLEKALLNAGLGMPRPRNVMIPALMMAIREGYKRIGLIGADHSWSKTLWVNEDNHVMTVQPHFYKDNEEETKRVENLYSTIRLHEMYQSLSIAFRSYFDVKRHAINNDAEIYNCTPGSFIDAFPRLNLKDF